MNYQNYYDNQARNQIPIFHGSAFQRGFGFGDIFKKFFTWIVPIVKKNALPLMKDVGRELVKTTSNIAYDTIDGQNFKNSTIKRINETMDYIQNQYGKGKTNILKKKYKLKGNKIKQKKKKKKLYKKGAKNKEKKSKIKEKKRILDIFSKR
jgi:hypothetical protein